MNPAYLQTHAPMTKRTAVRRILFATDYSENSRLALDYAVMFAQRFGATVYMLHVVLLTQAAHEAEIQIAGPSLSRDAAERRLETLADGLRLLGLTVETHVVDGFAGEVIPQSVLTYRIDLLVLGIHGLHHGLSYLLMGSTTELLLREAKCPVLTVGANVLSGFNLNEDLDHVFFVSDLSPEAAGAAPYALSLASALNVPVHLGACLPERFRQDKNRLHQVAEEYCRSMSNVLPAKREWSTPEFQLSHAMDTEELIAKAAQEHDAIIVLGIHSLNTSFARLLLSRASCPVITIWCEESLQARTSR